MLCALARQIILYKNFFSTMYPVFQFRSLTLKTETGISLVRPLELYF